jgi:hypothetical protein
MSLINEALKRAKQAHAENLPPKTSVPPMRPVEPEQSAPGKGFGAAGPVGLVVVAIAGLLIFFLIWKRDGTSGATVAPGPLPVAAKTPDREPAAGTSETSKAPASRTAANAASTPVSMADEHSQAAPISTEHSSAASSSGATNQTTSSGESADPNHLASVAGPSTPAPAPLKLQSIVFNPGRPSAMISGRIVFVGDRIRELRVMAIHREDVLLVGGGSTNLLSLDP